MSVVLILTVAALLDPVIPGELYAEMPNVDTVAGSGRRRGRD